MKARIVPSALIKPPLIPHRRLRGGFIGMLFWLACSWLFSQEAPTVPEWWQSRGVLKEGGTAVDYAPANQGQLKNFARAARDEMLAKGLIETGHAIDLMVQSWIGNTDAARDYSPANLGQLKTVSQPFYDRLIEVEHREPDSYPWSGPARPASDYSMANLGQLKAVFNFEIVNLDLDEDGMFDQWEQQIIDASTTDAITGIEQVQPLDDFDGDRIPNLWEFGRQTDPVDVSSTPSFDAVVGNGTHTSLLAAYDSLPGSEYHAIVWVKRGRHQGVVPYSRWVTNYQYEIIGYDPIFEDVLVGYYDPDPSDEIEEMVPIFELQQTGETAVYGDVPYPSQEVLPPKKVLWLGEAGASRATGDEGPVIATNGEGMWLSDDTVLDGLIFDGGGGSLSGSAITAMPADETNPLRIRLNNCIIRHFPHPSGAGALRIYDSHVQLIHSTIHQCAGFDSDTATYSEAVRIESGSLELRGSIIWDADAPVSAPSITGDLAALVIQPSLVQGGLQSALNVEPHLNQGGYLTSASEACLAAGQGGITMHDINGEQRSSAHADLGADEWVNTDASVNDHLPDWWEQWWVGSLDLDDPSDPDLDGILNAAEFLAMTAPIADQDDDALSDAWERQYWGGIQAQDASGNPDGDERSNLQEQAAGTNPTQVDADSDVDDDQLLDVWEISHWQNLAQDASGNPDDDERSNLQEQAAGTNPTQVDADSDVDHDGLFDVWEKSYWGSIGTQNGSDNPDSDFMTNLQEQAAGTNPIQFNNSNGDSDHDGWLDGWELAMFGTLAESRSTDFDGDGISNGTKQDAVRALATAYGWNLLSDQDQDNLTLEDEWLLGTNPAQADTDGDGANDDVDLMPLDPLIGSSPPNVEGPPVLTLSSPPGATLIP